MRCWQTRFLQGAVCDSGRADALFHPADACRAVKSRTRRRLKRRFEESGLFKVQTVRVEEEDDEDTSWFVRKGWPCSLRFLCYAKEFAEFETFLLLLRVCRFSVGVAAQYRDNEGPASRRMRFGRYGSNAEGVGSPARRRFLRVSGSGRQPAHRRKVVCELYSNT